MKPADIAERWLPCWNALGPVRRPIASLFITVDPARDTPDKLSDFLANFDGRITGLTGAVSKSPRGKAYRVYYSPAEHDSPEPTSSAISTFL